MKKKFMCMLMAAAMTLSMAACGSKGDDANNDANTDADGVQTFTVGTSGPLTGDNAIYGMAVKQGVELAVNEINASDSTIKFKFLSQDDEADGEKAVNAQHHDGQRHAGPRWPHHHRRFHRGCRCLLHRPYLHADSLRLLH